MADPVAEMIQQLSQRMLEHFTKIDERLNTLIEMVRQIELRDQPLPPDATAAPPGG